MYKRAESLRVLDFEEYSFELRDLLIIHDQLSTAITDANQVVDLKLPKAGIESEPKRPN